MAPFRLGSDVVSERCFPVIRTSSGLRAWYAPWPSSVTMHLSASVGKATRCRPGTARAKARNPWPVAESGWPWARKHELTAVGFATRS
jgi:hypothetical protein